jgi:hypothetical protein
MIVRAFMTLALALVLSVVLVASASAGEYTIHDCPGSLEPNFDAGPWQAYGGPLPAAGAFQGSCAPGGTLGGAIGWYGSEQSLNSNLGLMLQTPSPAITIRELRVVWSASHQSSGSDTWAQIITEAGAQLINETPFAADPSQVQFPEGTRTVLVYSYCSYDQSTNCYFPSGTTPIVKLEGMDTTLEDNEPPSATVTGGALAASGPLAGAVTLQFTATDQNSGVRGAQLVVDGAPVMTHSYTSQCPYTSFLACPASQTDSMTWDTTTVPNGEHVIALRVIDAAGNVQTVDEHTVNVANPTTVAPVSAPTGVTSEQHPCTAAQGTQTSIATNAERDTLHTGYQKRASLSGDLLGPGRKLVGDARMEVLVRPDVSGSAFSPLGHVVTDAKGRFALSLPPGVSRMVCLRYGPLGDDRYTAAVQVAQQVSAGVTLAVHPSRVGPNGTIVLTGNVLGGYISEAGKVVELQVLYLGRWRVFETVRSRPDGEFISFYTFVEGMGTFRFRARVRGENDYPYSLGHSNPVNVHAR